MDVYASWMVNDREMPSSVWALSRPPEDLAAYGDAARVAGQLAPYVRAFAKDREYHLMVRLHYPGMDVVESERHIERFATEVMPLLRRIAAEEATDGAG